jgi:16S rRNA processing protein RimM
MVKIGFFNKLNGYKGEVMLILEGIDFSSLKKQKFLFVELEGIPVPFFVENVLEKSGNAVVKFEDVNDSEYAKRLLNNPVFIEAKGRMKKPVVAAGTELIGYEVIDANYGNIGVIQKVEEYPQQLIATCLVNNKEVLIPLNESFLNEINDDEKKVFLTLPEGLLDVYLK